MGAEKAAEKSILLVVFPCRKVDAADFVLRAFVFKKSLRFTREGFDERLASFSCTEFFEDESDLPCPVRIRSSADGFSGEETPEFLLIQRIQ